MKSGPLDLRLSVGEKGRKCETCNEDLVLCPGHFGYVVLELPVFHGGFFKHVVNMLQSICKECSRVMLNDNDRVKYTKLMQNRKDPQEREAIRKTI
jgi:DNA-directed RNA polymerase III subunit RPC1